MQAQMKYPVVTYVECTPNPAAMKFVANKMIIADAVPMEFSNPAEAKSSPLATALFKFPFVKSVFISANYITIFKTDAIEWDEITLELREFLREYLSSGKLVVTSVANLSQSNENNQNTVAEARIENTSIGNLEHSQPHTDIEHKIIDTIEQYIRPPVEQDGGVIVFRSYKDGVVSILMRGACNGCPSSTVTLKTGIQTILKKFVPEVTEVISEE